MLKLMERIKGIIEEVIEERGIMKDYRLYVSKYKKFRIDDLKFILKENLKGEDYISIYKKHGEDNEEPPKVKGEYLLEGGFNEEKNKLHFTLTTPKNSDDQNFLVDYYFLIKLKDKGYEVIVEDVTPDICE